MEEGRSKLERADIINRFKRAIKRVLVISRFSRQVGVFLHPFDFDIMKLNQKVYKLQ